MSLGSDYILVYDSDGTTLINPAREDGNLEKAVGPLSYGTPSQSTVSSTASNIAASGTSGVFRKILIYVPFLADTGIHLNANGTATTSHFLLEPGQHKVYYTDQAISAIRAGATNVTAHVEIAE